MAHGIPLQPHSLALARHALRQAGRAQQHTEARAQTSQSEDVSQLLRQALSSTRTVQSLSQRDCLEYLKSVGFTSIEEMLRILEAASNPMSQYRKNEMRKGKGRGLPQARRLGVETELKPVVQFLQRQNFDATRVMRIISSHPPILCYDVETHLQPLLDALTAAGMKDPLSAVARRPSLLGLKPGASLDRILGYLQDSGKTQEEIVDLLETSI